MSTTFFCTIRPSTGFINEDSMTALKKYLLKQHAYVLSVEDKANMYTNGRHVHFSFLTNHPTRPDSIKRTLKVMMSKFYTNSQINVKIALTPQVIQYIEKDDFVLDSHNRNLLLDYIQHDHTRNLTQLEILKKYKETKILYAYDNKKTWIPIFKRYNKFSYMAWKLMIIDLDGNIPPSSFKLKYYYDYYKLIGNGETKIKIKYEAIQKATKAIQAITQNLQTSQLFPESELNEVNST